MIIYLICVKKPGRKLSGLAQISSYMSFEEKLIFLKLFVKCQFGYCPLTQMFHSRKANALSKDNALKRSKNSLQ